MRHVYFILFVISSIVHLYFSYKKDALGRAATKGIPLLMLIGMYVETVATPSWIVIGALFMSWLGDMLLIGKGVKWFTFGGYSFIASHILFIIAYLSNLTFFSSAELSCVSLCIITIFIMTSMLVSEKINPYLPNRGLQCGMWAYFLCNCLMNASAWIRLFHSVCLSSTITAVGASLFLISDITLFFVRFKKNTRIKSHFPVMITYLLGELLIVVGLI